MSANRNPHPGWTDQDLIEACLQGSELAWSALIDKYKKLVYSVIRKYRFDPEESADIFQSVWLDIYNDLAKLREHSALKSWMTTLTAHHCYRCKQRKKQVDFREVGGLAEDELEEKAGVIDPFAQELEQGQLIREAIFALSERCRKLIQLLFFTFPPQPYRDVAEQLGLAVGSIGFIRGRCLKRLQQELENKGL